jgi:hypothetical protein
MQSDLKRRARGAQNIGEILSGSPRNKSSDPWVTLLRNSQPMYSKPSAAKSTKARRSTRARDRYLLDASCSPAAAEHERHMIGERHATPLPPPRRAA